MDLEEPELGLEPADLGELKEPVEPGTEPAESEELGCVEPAEPGTESPEPGPEELEPADP